MARKSVDSKRNVWEVTKKKLVDEWEPNYEDIKWLVTVVAKMKIGGKWVVPAAGVTFEKVGQDHLRLESIVTDDLTSALVLVEKTKKVGERATIKVDIEKAADYVLFRPDLRKYR